jgi:hypothetical protein
MNNPSARVDLLYNSTAHVVPVSANMTSRVSNLQTDIYEADGSSESHPSKRRYFKEVSVQIIALLYVKLLLAIRNTSVTIMRLLTPLIFTILIYVVNIGLKARFASDPIYQDLTTPFDSDIGPIPDCESPGCIVLAYSPSIADGYVPATDFSSLSDFNTFLQSTSVCHVLKVGSLCFNTTCDGVSLEPTCAALCEAWRIHRVVRGMMRNNGGVNGTPIQPQKTLGFCNSTGLDHYLLGNPGAVQGGILFSSTGDNRTTFAVVTNSTPYLVLQVAFKYSAISLSVSSSLI